MALPMDRLRPDQIAGSGAVATAGPPPSMPPESPVAMPEQRLDVFDQGERRAFVDAERSSSPFWPRVAVFGGAIAITAGVVFEMGRSLALGGLTPLELVVVVLFALNIGWIALTFVTALAGAVLVTQRRPKPALASPAAGRTAVLMPTYNESPARIFAAIEAMASGVRTIAPEDRFDWFVLSDTTDPRIALAEETAFHASRSRFGGSIPLYYRRRRRNRARKSGNIADFCGRWGGAYDYLLILDADSLMEPGAIVELARRMDSDADAGLIQTVPRLVHGRTAFARLQQFAGRLYGPVLAAGLAWWAGPEGNYWGHNAILRRRAFTEAAGLPSLPGRPPFGGDILSHDFVEAALIRRAGWAVRIADDVAGSYEESPPSLLDFAARDRRWCQGNLQHARIVRAAGLHWVSRLHLLNGIFSYLASLLWLLLIVASLGMAVQASFTPLDYFEEPFQLFPTWPRIDSQLQIELLAITVLLLIAPKIFGLVAALVRAEERRRFRGALRLVASFATELVLSALIAPVMMLIQSAVIVSILMRSDSGWRSQRREGQKLSLREAFEKHRWQVAGGILIAAAAWWVSPVLLAWLSPALLGLLLAAPISALTASSRFGRALRRRGLLITPEERALPLIGRESSSCRIHHRVALSTTPDIERLVVEDQRRRLHLALLDTHPSTGREIDPIEAIAAAKINQAESLQEALASLMPDEQAIALAVPHLFTKLTSLPSAASRERSESRAPTELAA
jgi:membrane glycosyltransferase